MTALEKQNGDLRRQLDKQLMYAASQQPDDDHDQLSREELARRYCKSLDSKATSWRNIHTVYRPSWAWVACIRATSHRSIVVDL